MPWDFSWHMPYCFQSWWCVSRSFNSSAIWIYFFRLFVCFDFHCSKIYLFSITSCQVFVNAISTSCDFCLKNLCHFFFSYLMLYKLLLQKFRMECFGWREVCLSKDNIHNNFRAWYSCSSCCWFRPNTAILCFSRKMYI